MNEKDIHNETCMTAEPAAALTYGMSPALIDSDLLGRIHSLSRSDKQCLLRYIENDVMDETDDDALWETFPSGILFNPYEHTQEEIEAHMEKIMEDYKRGEWMTAKVAREELKQEFPWLR